MTMRVLAAGAACLMLSACASQQALTLLDSPPQGVCDNGGLLQPNGEIVCANVRRAEAARAEYETHYERVARNRLGLENATLLGAALTAGYAVFDAHPGNVEAAAFGTGLLGVARANPNRSQRLAILYSATRANSCLVRNGAAAAQGFHIDNGGNSLFDDIGSTRTELGDELRAAAGLIERHGDDLEAEDIAALQRSITKAEAAYETLGDARQALIGFNAAYGRVLEEAHAAIQQRWETGRADIEAVIASIRRLDGAAPQGGDAPDTPDAEPEGDPFVPRLEPGERLRRIKESLERLVADAEMLAPQIYIDAKSNLASCLGIANG